jgi:hypothetical protein
MIYTLKGTDKFGDELYAGAEDDGSITVWGPSRKVPTLLDAIKSATEYEHPGGLLVVRSDDPVYLGATMAEFVGMTAELVQGDPPEGAEDVETLEAPMSLEDGAALVSALIELACYGRACAPPPVGRGGSLKGGQSGYHLAAMSKEYDESRGGKAAVQAAFPKAHIYVHPDAEISEEVYAGIAAAAALFPSEVTNQIEVLTLGAPAQIIGGRALGAFGANIPADLFASAHPGMTIPTSREVGKDPYSAVEAPTNTKVANVLIFTDVALQGLQPDNRLGNALFNQVLDGTANRNPVLINGGLQNSQNYSETKSGITLQTVYGSFEGAGNLTDFTKMIAIHELGHATEYLMLSKKIAAEGMNESDQILRDSKRERAVRAREVNGSVRDAAMYVMTEGMGGGEDWPNTKLPKNQYTKYATTSRPEMFAEQLAMAAIGHPLGPDFIGQIKNHPYGVDLTSVLGSVTPSLMPPIEKG